ncbi:hypothetical protein [Bacillus sp. FJAT-14266]|uniref:hypothetical protein n=1 Tax=Bacillus sp. FJAT-14266 TaxID=1837130 RepID=UPI0012EAF273
MAACSPLFYCHQSILYQWKNRTNDKHAVRCQWIGGSILPIAVGWSLDESPVQTAF